MIDVAHRGGIATLTLNRPGARNALATRHWLRLAEAVAAIADSDARVVLLRSADPRCFCAGADLNEFTVLAADAAARQSFLAAMRAAIDGLAVLPLPVIGVVEGECHGAGVALMMACDIVLAGRQARFSIPAARIGLTYPVADIRRLTARAGPGGAARLLLAAERIAADEALRLRLVYRVEERPEAAGDAMAQAMMANDGVAMALLKQRIADPDAADDQGGFLDRFGADSFLARLQAARSGMGQR
ncbi:enoyl-CoA hydratase/isomerase family protein [Sphingomonas sp. BGYR3]|uniref:enoyl-CoA hydratase/isomerase family protein n=1 Tax=Sphingomonas sp. BGYR3 TaxID=2975483 RepID=UPI0021A4DE69|nr:enoyl-CoA hydratase/isomerase family protein [Sphingomonas sp. BGYR3]MDG5487355.1 enoyl-CoA hydratase/isomerase family protein [Sphingomonas sp. BGYR3]